MVMPAALDLALRKTPAQIAYLWVIDLLAGVTLRFTNLDRDVVFDGHTYTSELTFGASALASNLRGNAQNMDVTMFIDGDSIRADYAERGVYNDAKVRYYICDYSQPDETAFLLFSGFINQVSIVGRNIIQFAVRSTVKGDNPLVARYSATCRANFGDSACKVDVEALASNVTVSAVNGPDLITITGASGAGNLWRLGGLVWLTGVATGKTIPILSSTANTITVLFPFPVMPTIGDTARAYRGCAKTVAACQAYNNLLNYRGEPRVPQKR